VLLLESLVLGKRLVVVLEYSLMRVKVGHNNVKVKVNISTWIQVM